jgi:hypothetical protein
VKKAHIGFEPNPSGKKKGSDPEPFWEASMPKRFRKTCFGWVRIRAGLQKTHIGFEPNPSGKKGLRPGTLLESIDAEAIQKELFRIGLDPGWSKNTHTHTTVLS